MCCSNRSSAWRLDISGGRSESFLGRIGIAAPYFCSHARHAATPAQIHGTYEAVCTADKACDSVLQPRPAGSTTCVTAWPYIRTVVLRLYSRCCSQTSAQKHLCRHMCATLVQPMEDRELGKALQYSASQNQQPSINQISYQVTLKQCLCADINGKKPSFH